jgi:hypothetical protein
LADTSLGLKNFQTTLLDESAERFYYANYYDTSGSINFVNLSQPASKGSVPKGTTETKPGQIEGMATCPGSSVLYVLEDVLDDQGMATDWNRISSVDVATGNRHTLVDAPPTGPSTGAGVPLMNVRSFICSAGVLFASLGKSFEAMEFGCVNGTCPENKIVALDPATGDRLVVSFFSANTQNPIPGR